MNRILVCLQKRERRCEKNIANESRVTIKQNDSQITFGASHTLKLFKRIHRGPSFFLLGVCFIFISLDVALVH